MFCHYPKTIAKNFSGELKSVGGKGLFKKRSPFCERASWLRNY